MQQEEKDRRRKRMSTVYYIFGIFMVLFYVGMAYVMIFSPIFVKSISAPIRYSMGMLFLLYGIFRGYRQVKDMKSNFGD